MLSKLADTQDNNIKVKILKTIKETDWVGNIVHTSLDKCLTVINFNTNNSGHYKPATVRIAKLKGFYLVNQDGSLHFDSRVIKENDDKFLIETLTMKAYNYFEREYSKNLNNC